MVYISKLQEETLLAVDRLIDEGKSYDEILHWAFDNGYQLRVPMRNGYVSKTTTELCKNNEYTFVDIKKKRNGTAEWQTIRLS